MNTLVWHSAALLLALATVALVLVTGHATLRSLALALGAGTAVVVGMLVISSTGVITERASGAMTPTIGGVHPAVSSTRSVRLSGIGWEVAARPVVVTIDAPGRWRPRIARVMPDGEGRIELTVAVPFARHISCTATAVQLTVLGALRASAPCDARPVSART